MKENKIRPNQRAPKRMDWKHIHLPARIETIENVNNKEVLGFICGIPYSVFVNIDFVAGKCAR